MAKGHSKFKMQYGEELAAHMAKGYSIRSFAAVSKIPYSTLMYWADTNKNFKKFLELGESLSQHYWETVGIAAAQGQLQRVKSEKILKTTIFDASGRELQEGESGAAVREQLIDRAYEPTRLEGTIWRFVMASRFKWYDKQDPASLDPEKAGPAQTLKRFQLAYSLDDQPYVVTVRPAKGEAPDVTQQDQPCDTRPANADNPSDPQDNSISHNRATQDVHNPSTPDVDNPKEPKP